MGTEEFWVPAALAAVSAGTQYVNTEKATSRANASETQAINDQSEIRAKANSQVRGLTEQIAKNSPQQLAAKSTGEYVSQLRKNAAGSAQGGSTSPGEFGRSTSALPPTVRGNSRYGESVASGQREVQDFGNTTAQQLGNLDAATRQRQNEGLGMQTLGTNLNTIGLESYGKNFVDQLRSQAAGQTNPYVTLMSNLIGGAGNAMSMNPDAYFAPAMDIGAPAVAAKKYGKYGGSNYTPANDGWSGALA